MKINPLFKMENKFQTQKCPKRKINIFYVFTLVYKKYIIRLYKFLKITLIDINDEFLNRIFQLLNDIFIDQQRQRNIKRAVSKIIFTHFPF